MFSVSLAIFLFGLVAALGGGALGAAIGGNHAFVFTGLMIFMAWGVFAATESTWAFDYIAFGPFFGPHVAFAGGAAAAAYAANAKRYRVLNADLTESDEVASGKDVNNPLVRLNRPDVLAVGALFGAIGYAIQVGITLIPWLGSNVDSVALTVIISAFIHRIAFGGSLLNSEKYNDASGFMGKIAPSAEHAWLRWQEQTGNIVAIGFFFGVAGGAVALATASLFPGAAGMAHVMPFAMSAVVILFLINGFSMPVQHHATIAAGLFAVKFLPVFLGQKLADFDYVMYDFATKTSNWDNTTWMIAIVVILLAGVVGIIGMALAELSARLFYIRGNSHIDPPAMSIWITSVFIHGIAGAIAG